MIDLLSTDLLWRNALAAVPVAIAVWIAARFLPCRASTRHAMWVIVLLVLLAPPSFFSTTELESAFQRTGGWLAMKPDTASPQPESTLHEPGDAAGAQASPLGRAVMPPNSNPSDRRQASAPRPVETTIGGLHAAAINDQPVKQRSKSARVTPRTEQLPADSTVLAESALGTMPLDYSAPVAAPGASRVPTDSTAAAWRAHELSEAISISPSASTSWRRWWSGLETVRTELTQVPPLPTELWLGGSLVFGVVLLWRAARFGRLLRRATPADSLVQCEVDRAAERLGLRRIPVAVMVKQRVSPMVWCGRCVRLILPADLWSELDALGRSAVLMHELAHLKRRDHWICRLEAIIGVLYWWHPMVWWVRSRLRDEADLSCDAWVTALLPSGRRAYAGALLATQTYINESRYAVPAVGLGVTRRKTKRFARRLTMVMTERSAPRMSIMGIMLAASVAAAAWLSTPIWACPPEDKPVELKQKTPKPARVKVPRQPAPAAPAESTFERHMQERGGNTTPPAAPQPPSPPVPPQASLRGLAAGVAIRGLAMNPHAAPGAMGDHAMHERLNMLENRLNRLTEHLGRLSGQHAAGHAPAPMAQADPLGGERREAPSQESDDQMVTRVYHLPDGKLQDLYELMARQDVPVLVSQQDGGIAVQATPWQHEIFQGFVDMINPPKQGERRAAPRARGGVSVAPNSGRMLQQELELRAQTMARAAEELGRRHEHRLAAIEKMREGRLAEAHQRFAMQREEMAKRMHGEHQQAAQARQRAHEARRRAEEARSRALSATDPEERESLEAEIESLLDEASDLEEQADDQSDEAGDLASELEDLAAELGDVLTESYEEAEEAIQQAIEELQAAEEVAAENATETESEESAADN